jgi:hypothetical protein
MLVIAHIITVNSVFLPQKNTIKHLCDACNTKILLTDVINVLPYNSSVNMVQHAIIDEVVFSTSSAPSSGATTGICNAFLNNGSVNTLPRKR